MMWKSATLEKVCNIYSGNSINAKKKSELYTDVDGLPYVATKDISFDGVIDYDNGIAIPKEVSISFKVAPENTVFVCAEGGSAGRKIAISDRPVCFVNKLFALVTDGKILPKFIYYFTLSESFQFQFKDSLTGLIGGVSLSKIKKFSISFPPLEEQKRIVEILDEAFVGIDQAIANTEKNLQNARNLFESYLNNIFTQKGDGWVTGALSDIGADIKTGPFGSLLHKSDYIENGTPLINPAHIIQGSIIPDVRKTVNQEAFDRLSSYHVQFGDVIIGRRGDMGRCAPITETEDGWLCGTGCFIIRPKNGHDAKFLSLLLSSNFYIDEITKLASGATMLNLSNKALGSLTVSLPALDVQKSILEQINIITADQFKLNQIYTQKLADLKELKQSLLQKAFAGELTYDMRPAA